MARLISGTQDRSLILRSLQESPDLREPSRGVTVD